LRRKGTRRTSPRTPGGTQSAYEEEEGYASGEYDDAPFELAKIRVKVDVNVNSHVQCSCVV